MTGEVRDVDQPGSDFDRMRDVYMTRAQKASYDRIEALARQALALRAEPAWRGPDEIPEVVAGGSAYFWVAVRRKHDGRVYSFPAQYLNAMLLCNEWSDETEHSGNRYHHGPTDEDEGNFPATGWHVEKEHGEYDGVYSPLLDATDELVAWCEVANYPGVDAPPAAPEGMVAVVEQVMMDMGLSIPRTSGVVSQERVKEWHGRLVDALAASAKPQEVGHG